VESITADLFAVHSLLPRIRVDSASGGASPDAAARYISWQMVPAGRQGMNRMPEPASAAGKDITRYYESRKGGSPLYLRSGHPDRSPVSAMKSMKFDVFGKEVRVSRDGGRWTIHYVGAEGKRRPATDILVPAELPASEIERYLADLCHEWATTRHPNVRRLG
jgi:hypothetical protein